MDKRIKELQELKQEVIEMSCIQNGHQYQKWSKQENEYSRVCQKCKYIEKIKSTAPISEIEEEINKQKIANTLLEYLCAKENNNISSENIIFYIYTIKDYLNYLDIEKLKNRITEINTPTLENQNEYNIINFFVTNINNSDTNIWQEIDNYIEQLLPKPKKASL